MYLLKTLYNNLCIHTLMYELDSSTIAITHLSKICRGSGKVAPITWFNLPKPGSQSRALCGTVCEISIAYSTLLNWPIVSLFILFYFILFTNVFCILVHYYTLCFIGSLCYNFSDYICISIWPYYIVIHSLLYYKLSQSIGNYELTEVFLIEVIGPLWYCGRIVNS